MYLQVPLFLTVLPVLNRQAWQLQAVTGCLSLPFQPPPPLLIQHAALPGGLQLVVFLCHAMAVALLIPGDDGGVGRACARKVRARVLPAEAV